MTVSREHSVPGDEFIGQTAACILSGRSPSWVLRMALVGRIQTRLERGECPKFRKADVIALKGVSAR